MFKKENPETTPDQRVRESLMNLASALEGKIEAKRNEPPKEAGLWSRMMRR